MNVRRLLFSLLALLIAAPFASADSISPNPFSKKVTVGESFTITKTVTIDNAPPTSAKVDVFFLCDTTGSMGGIINSVKSSASTILSQTGGLGDVQFAVGEYKDIYDSYAYRVNQALTSNQSAAQSGINMWGASGGGDGPEANLYALHQMATGTPWRDGSTRVAVWFGDYYGHNPRNGVSLSDAIAALNADSIVVQALDSGSSYYGLNGSGGGYQATAITSATAGNYYSSINTSNVVAKIQESIESTFASYNSVSLDLSGVPTGLSLVSDPVSHVGTFDRSTARDFEFELTFTADEVGVYDFSIGALSDGGLIATESDIITVTSGGTSNPTVPEPTALAVWSVLGLAAAARSFRRRKKNKE